MWNGGGGDGLRGRSASVRSVVSAWTFEGRSIDSSQEGWIAASMHYIRIAPGNCDPLGGSRIEMVCATTTGHTRQLRGPLGASCISRGARFFFSHQEEWSHESSSSSSARRPRGGARREAAWRIASR